MYFIAKDHFILAMGKHFNVLFRTIVLLLLFLGLQEQVRVVIDKCLLPIFSIEQHWAIDVLVVLLGIFVCWKCKTKKIVCSDIELSVLLGILFAYIYYRCFDQIYLFTKWRNTSVAYLDIIALYTVLYIILSFRDRLKSFGAGFIQKTVLKKRIGVGFINKCRKLFGKRKKHTHKGYVPQEDNPIGRISEDKFGMEEHVKRVVSYIGTVDVSSKAFSLGVVANWGYGKSSFFNFIKEKIEKEPNFIVLDFNPRSSKDISYIQEDFLNGLKEVLNPFHSNLTKVFQDYARALNISTDVSPIVSIFLNVFRVHEKSWKDSYEAINDVIKRINKRIIVFVDDLDRLTAKELLEVMKVIDKNGAFSNVIFVCAYDKEYVNGALKSYLNHDVKCPYTDKYFDLEIKLPKHASYMMVDYLQELFLNACQSGHISKSKETVDAGMRKADDCIKKRLGTIRDVKRFANQFLYDYPAIQNEVEFGDYLLLELMKFSHKEEYDKLRDQYYIETAHNDSLEVDVYCLKDNVPAANSDDIMQKLFPKKEQVQSVYAQPDKRIFNISFFDMYFFNNEYNHLLQNDFNALYDLSLKEKCEKIQLWMKGNDLNMPHALDLKSYILSRTLQNMGNREQLQSYFQILMYLYHLTNSYVYFERIRDLFGRRTYNELSGKYGFKRKPVYLRWIGECLSDFLDFQPQVSSLLFPRLLDEMSQVKNNEKSFYFFTCNDFLQEAEKLFDKYMERIEKPDWDPCVAFALSDINTIDSEHYIPIMSKLRAMMLGSPQKFYKALFPVIISSKDNNKRYLSFNAHFHLKDVFPNLGDFDKLIKKKFNTEPVLRRFYKLYRKNNCEPIELTDHSGRIPDIVDKLHEGLNELEDVAAEINVLREKWHHEKKVKSIGAFVNQLTGMKDNLSKGTLRIKYVDELEEDIDSLIAYIKIYKREVTDISEFIEVGDLIRFKENWFLSNRNIEGFNSGINVFKVEQLLSNKLIKLDGVMEIIPMNLLEPIPIDGKSDKSIGYRSNGYQDISQSYYMDYFDNSAYSINQSWRDVFEELDIEYVHEIQHWLRSKNIGDLFIRHTKK